jgi:hypothetical protein
MSDYHYFIKDYLSGSEITATVCLVLSIFHSIWVIRSYKEAKAGLFVLRIFISILILVLYYVLKSKKYLPVGLGTNIVYFCITFIAIIFYEVKLR